MIQRIVKLTLSKQTDLEAFRVIYDARNPMKNKVKGCRSVKIMKEINDENVYYTVSMWDSDADLEAYRSSAYFKETWPMVKAHLAVRAEAFTLKDITEL